MQKTAKAVHEGKHSMTRNAYTPCLVAYGLQKVQPTMAEGFYVYDLYQKRKLDEAEAYFRFLYVYDFQNPDCVLGLAAIYQLRKQYIKAVNLYAIAFALARDDYRAVLFSGLCQLALDNIAQARQCFQLVCDKSNDNRLKTRAAAYLKIT